MFFKKLELPRGERIHATVRGRDLEICFRRGKGVYRALCGDYWESPFLEAPALAVYCDEACPLSGGGMVERRNSTIKLREV